MTRTDRQFHQSFETQTPNTRSRGPSFGRLAVPFMMASCCRSVRFSAANSVRLRRTDLRKTKISCTEPMLLSQTHYLQLYMTRHERSRSGRCVKFEQPLKCPKTAFSTQIRFLGGTGRRSIDMEDVSGARSARLVLRGRTLRYALPP